MCLCVIYLAIMRGSSLLQHKISKSQRMSSAPREGGQGTRGKEGADGGGSFLRLSNVEGGGSKRYYPETCVSFVHLM